MSILSVIYFDYAGDKVISKRRQETFKRIKRSTLAKMLEVG